MRTKKCPQVCPKLEKSDMTELIISVDYDNQDQLIAATIAEMSDAEHDRLFNHARSISRERGIDLTLHTYGVDVIIAPADSAFNLLVSSAGMFHGDMIFEPFPTCVYRIYLCNHATIYS